MPSPREIKKYNLERRYISPRRKRIGYNFSKVLQMIK